MNNTAKKDKLQVRTLQAVLQKQQTIDTAKLLQEAVSGFYPLRCRNRVFNPLTTLSLFVSQAMGKDSSCQKAVNGYALELKKPLSLSTGAYCKARGRLELSMVQTATANIAKECERNKSAKWTFEGRNIYLIDGTTLTMPDTQSNQNRYPQQKVHPKGLGFPICRIVGVISLATGVVIDAKTSAYQGKGASEQTLLRSMLHHFKPGDIVIADAFYSSYSLLEYCKKNGIDLVFAQNGVRAKNADFSKGKIIGKNDHFIEINKPKVKPGWMDKKAYEQLAQCITIRELKAGNKTLITTLNLSRKKIKKLYEQRWHIEVDFRNIKSTMGLKMLSCKSPDMALKELWTYLLAYNIIRLYMLQAALHTNRIPRQLSFAHTLQLTISLHAQNNHIPKEYFFTMISQKKIGNRPNRIEPRAIKKRPDNHKLLKKPRDLARKEIKLYGHPKKLK